MPKEDEATKEFDTFLGQICRGMATELAELKEMKLGCDVCLSREFRNFQEGTFVGTKIKLTLEPDREDYE
jgi:hypothetical protein